MSAPETGEKIGKYRLVELVGQGGMASVYRAVDDDLDREVAIKILHPHLQTRRDARKRFRREAKSVARLAHRNIVAIFDYSGEDARTSYIVTQFIRGTHLKKLSEKHGAFPHELAASMARQVTAGLIVAHRAGIVHRDIKPENILVDEEGILKIADFGIALVADTQEMTATGQILGSPYYMSPEHVLGKGLDKRADVFSFASLLYWMVTGRQAFEGPNPHAVIKRIVDGEVEPAERYAPDAGQAMGEIIRASHEKDIEKRLPDLEPVAEMLDRYLAGCGVEDPVAEVKRYLSSPTTYRRDVKPRTVKALMREGDLRRRDGDIGRAMDAYNRVLALEPDHAAALRRVQDVASARSRRRLLTRLCVLGAAALAVTAVVVWGPRLLAAIGGGDASVPSTTDASADVFQGKVEVPVVDLVGVPAVDPTKPPPGVEDGGTSEDGKKPPDDRLPVKKAYPPGIVKFAPYPKTVIIWVDGTKVGEYYNHQDMQLSVGKHKIRFEPVNPECCEPVEWMVDVEPQEPGAKPQKIERSLPIKPARLYVMTLSTSGKPAKVLVDGEVMGPAGKPLSVPMKGVIERKATLAVTAEGYTMVPRSITLKAGEMQTITIDLEPTG